MLNVLADDNGFIPVEDRPISKVGVFPYLGSSIGASEPNRIYMVYRPASELSNKETINSFKLVPLIDEHEMLGTDATPAEKKGVQGTTGENIYFKDGVLYGNMKVYSERMKNLIEGGKKELSLGYKCKYVFESGNFEGKQYDAIQTNLRGNHIALVEEGRMGKEVSVVDGALKTVVTMDRNDIKLKEQEVAITKEEMQAVLDEALKPIEDRVNALDEAVKKKAEDVEIEIKKEEEKKDEGQDAKSYDEMKKEYDAMCKDMEEMKKQMDEMKKDSKGQDESIKKTVMQELAQRDRLALKLTPLVGSFDHLDMDLNGVVSYGVDKLKLDVVEGQELATLNGYLAAAKVDTKSQGMDSKKEFKTNKISTSLDVFNS